MDKLKELIPSGNDELVDSLTQLLDLIEKSSKDEPCDDTIDDCQDLLSPCCNFALDTVFGTLPLEVVCLSCNKSYILHDLLNH